MTLTEYNAICSRLENFCIYARRRAPYGEPELLERAVAFERELLTEYNAKAENLIFESIGLKGNPAQKDIIARCRQNFAVSGQISTLVDDLKGGAVDCPEGMKGRLIMALKGLLSLVSSLSRACVQEFDKTKPQGKTVPEEIEEEHKARKVCERLQKAGHMDKCYFPSNNQTQEQRALMAQGVGRYLRHGGMKRICEYWGLDYDQTRKYASGANPIKPKIKAILDIINA